MTQVVVGVDVGGDRKGFDVAVLDGMTVRLRRTTKVGDVVDLAADAGLVGIDAPAAWAPDGQASRPDERSFARAGICGIRFTPDEATARARTDDHLGWIWNGLALYEALADAAVDTAEVFPTAAWTRWCGARGGRTRLAWTRAGWNRLRADGLVADAGDRPTQDAMDAVAAALVARQARAGTVDRFGGLVVPAAGTWPVTGGA